MELALVVPAGPCEHQRNRSGLGAPSRPPGPLLVVRDARWHIAAEHGLEFADVNTEFHRRRTAEQVDFTLPEPLLDARPLTNPDRRCVLARDRSQWRSQVSVNVVVTVGPLPPVGVWYRCRAPVTPVLSADASQVQHPAPTARRAAVKRPIPPGNNPHRSHIENMPVAHTLEKPVPGFDGLSPGRFKEHPGFLIREPEPLDEHPSSSVVALRLGQKVALTLRARSRGQRPCDRPAVTSFTPD